jgi:hypothetical protein
MPRLQTAPTTIASPRKPATSPDLRGNRRVEVEALLREVAFVLHATRSVRLALPRTARAADPRRVVSPRSAHRLL